jgi:hypothetical protein
MRMRTLLLAGYVLPRPAPLHAWTSQHPDELILVQLLHLVFRESAAEHELQV